MRVRFGPFELPRGLKQGRLLELDPDVVSRLEQVPSPTAVTPRLAPSKKARGSGAPARKRAPVRRRG